MNLLVHASAGALVGQYTGNPYLGFIYGFISHVILDVIPHGDSQLYKKYKSGELSAKKAMALTVIDSVTTVVFVLVFFSLGIHKSTLVTAMAIIGSVIPDIFIGFYELLSPKAPKWLQVIHKWHFKNHDYFAIKHDLSFRNGLILQLIIFLVLIKIL